MPLEVGGITYPAAPFNGWYLGTEIGARNLVDADRYDLLPVIAERLGLDTSSERTLWRDRALVEMMRAVQHSFDVAGVTMADHHTESRRFLRHVDREERAGRRCPADWSWIVPPVSGGLTPVYHRYYDEPDPTTRPAFLLPLPAPQPERIPASRGLDARESRSGCARVAASGRRGQARHLAGSAAELGHRLVAVADRDVVEA